LKQLRRAALFIGVSRNGFCEQAEHHFATEEFRGRRVTVSSTVRVVALLKAVGWLPLKAFSSWTKLEARLLAVFFEVSDDPSSLSE
jgi:hypothetical protein